MKIDQLADLLDTDTNDERCALGTIPACLAGPRPDTRHLDPAMTYEAIDRKLITGKGTGEVLGISHVSSPR